MSATPESEWAIAWDEIGKDFPDVTAEQLRSIEIVHPSMIVACLELPKDLDRRIDDAGLQVLPSPMRNEGFLSACAEKLKGFLQRFFLIAAFRRE